MAQDTIHNQQDFQDYLEALKSPLVIPIFKIVFLNPDETEREEITGDLFDVSGTLQNTLSQTGVRRSFTMQLDNSDNKYDIEKNNIFIGQKVALYAGIRSYERDFLFKQGIFYLTTPQDSTSPGVKTVTLTASDKWYGLSKLYGFLDSVYYIPVVLEGSTNNQELVAWSSINRSNISSTGNTITRATGTGWNSWIQSGFRLNTGSFEFKISSSGQNSIIGFSNEYNGTSSQTSIVAGIKIDGNKYYIMKNNSPSEEGTFSSSDIFKLHLLMDSKNLTKSYVLFYKNGTQIDSMYDISQESYLIAATINNSSGSITALQYSISTQIFEYNIYDLMSSILQLPQRSNIRIIANMAEIIGENIEQINNSINTYIYTDRKMSGIRVDEAVKDISTNNIYVCISNNDPNTIENTVWKLFTDNITPLDPKLPVLDPFFNEIDNGARLIMPYSIQKTRSDTYASIFEDFATMFPCNIYYDIDGRLRNEPTSEDVLDTFKEILFDFNDLDSDMYSVTSTLPTEEIYNDITVVGTIQDVGTHSVRVINEDPRIVVNTSAVHNISKTYNNLPTYSTLMFSRQLARLNPTWTTEQLKEESLKMIRNNIKELANYYLKQHSALATSIVITCNPLYHLEVDRLVNLTINGKSEKYLIRSYSLPLNSSGSMTINCQRAIDFVDRVEDLMFTTQEE